MQLGKSGTSGTEGSREVPRTLERDVYSGRLAGQVVDRGVLNGGGDLLLSLMEVSKERLFTPGERLREIGRRTGDRVCQRLQSRLQQEWMLDSPAGLPWALFASLVSQVSALLGFGDLQMRADEASGLVSITAWNSPFPELLQGEEPTCLVIEGFVASFLEAVSRSSVDAVESACRATGADSCQFVVGPQQAVRRYLGSKLTE